MYANDNLLIMQFSNPTLDIRPFKTSTQQGTKDFSFRVYLLMLNFTMLVIEFKYSSLYLWQSCIHNLSLYLCLNMVSAKFTPLLFPISHYRLILRGTLLELCQFSVVRCPLSFETVNIIQSMFTVFVF